MHNSAGDWTFMRNKNVTIAVQKMEKKSTPVRSQRQMNRRSYWANQIAMWRSFKGCLKPSFEYKDDRMSDFNAFMRTNLAGGTRVYLKRTDVIRGACVVTDYYIACGRLQTIEVEVLESGRMQSDIALGNEFQINANTTVAEFSKAVIDNNGNRFEENDQITCFLATQLTVGSDNMPRVTMKSCRVTLSQDDRSKLYTHVHPECFAVSNGCLSSRDAVNGGIAWVHSHIEKGKTQVSTQRLVVNNSVASLYTTAAARDAAIESYGGVNKNDYLTPDITEDEDVNVNP